MWPRLLRAPVEGLPSVSGLCGRSVVSSAKSDRVCWREAGFVGLICLIPMRWLLDALEELDLRAFLQAHVRLLPVRAAAHELALSAHLAVAAEDAHVLDLDVLELRLDRLLDLDLVGPRVDLEGADVLGLLLLHHLLGEERPADHLFEPHRDSTSTRRPSAPSESTRWPRSTTL